MTLLIFDDVINKIYAHKFKQITLSDDDIIKKLVFKYHVQDHTKNEVL